VALSVSDHGPWEVEEIPNGDSVFYRVSRGWLNPTDPQLSPGVFREHDGSMSCDWNKYSEAHETRARTGAPLDFGVIRLHAGGLRKIEGLILSHDPDFPLNNRAHSSVTGLGPSKGLDSIARARLTGIRGKLFEQFHSWEINLSEPL
jgi:hypothetical protein